MRRFVALLSPGQRAGRAAVAVRWRFVSKRGLSTVLGWSNARLRVPRPALTPAMSGARQFSVSGTSLFGGRVPGTGTSGDWDTVAEGAPASELASTVTSGDWNTVAEGAGGQLAPASELASAGLGGYSPVGLLQTSLEWLHLHTGMPWWLSVIAATVVMRTAMFPLVVHLQKNAARISMAQPEIMTSTEKLQEFRKTGDNVGLAQEAVRMQAIYRKYGCHPLKLFTMPLVQMPVFISFFMALREMARAPVASMTTGGALWFSNLTVPDPFYVLPLVACVSFLVNIEMGGEVSGPTNPTHQMVKNILRVSAVAILPLSITFPSALFMYWVTNSLLSAVVILLLKIPQVKVGLGIPIVPKRHY